MVGAYLPAAAAWLAAPLSPACLGPKHQPEDRSARSLCGYHPSERPGLPGPSPACSMAIIDQQTGCRRLARE